MRNLLLCIGILLIPGSILSQKSYPEKIDFDYVRLPLNPLPEGNNYSCEVLFSYEEDIILANKEYEKEVTEAHKESKAQKQEYDNQSFGVKVINRAVFKEGEPTEIMVKEDYLAKMYDSEMIKRDYMQISGLDATDDSEYRIILDMEGFQVGEVTEINVEKKRKVGDEYKTYFVHENAVNHKHPMSISVTSNKNVYTFHESFSGLNEYKTSYTSEYLYKSELHKYWNASKNQFLSVIDDKQTKENLKIVSEFLNNNFGYKKIRREVEIWMIKNKKHDYSDLYEAYEKIVTGYNNYIDQDQIEESKKNIQDAIFIWEKALAEYKPNVKKARINNKAAAAIHLNCAEAYIWLNNYNEANKHINKIVILNIAKFENRSDKLKEFLKDQKLRFKASVEA